MVAFWRLFIGKTFAKSVTSHNGESKNVFKGGLPAINAGKNL